MEYLGHMVSIEGVHTNTKKVAAINEWPIPLKFKKLRGFFGLTGYYKKFVKDYAIMNQPLGYVLSLLM